jgi:predicted nuclease with TOPRIM domain
MDDDNCGLFEDGKHPGSWRERLERENSRLEAENAELREKGLRHEAEIKRLEKRMRTLMSEKVTREDQAAVSISICDTRIALKPRL